MAQIRADEITSILRQEIENYERAVDVSEIGAVISVGDGIARIHGLEKVMAGELIEFPHDVAGIAMNLEEDQVGAVLLGGVFANAVMIRHTPEEFCFDFIANLFPRPVVVSRVYMAAGRVPSLVEAMSSAVQRYQQHGPSGPPPPPPPDDEAGTI